MILFIDSMTTLLTWLPHVVFNIISTNFMLNTDITFSADQVSELLAWHRIQQICTGILLTNCITSPIIYVCLNKPFRVSKLHAFPIIHSIFTWSFIFIDFPYFRINLLTDGFQLLGLEPAILWMSIAESRMPCSKIKTVKMWSTTTVMRSWWLNP